MTLDLSAIDWARVGQGRCTCGTAGACDGVGLPPRYACSMTAEQRARDLLDSMCCVFYNGSDRECDPEVREPRDMSAGELVELANLIAERDKLAAELIAIRRRVGEQVLDYNIRPAVGELILGDD